MDMGLAILVLYKSRGHEELHTRCIEWHGLCNLGMLLMGDSYPNIDSSEAPIGSF